MNFVIETGRLTRDPEIRSTTTGTSVADFSIAVNGGKDQVYFFPCEAWGKTAEFVDKYLHKGTKVIISGYLKYQDWQNNDGKKHSKILIVADKIEFAESKGSEPQKPKADEFMQVPDNVPDEELPFA